MPEQSATLRDMIQDALDNGVSYRDLESRAVDPETGETASRAVFHDTVSGKLKRMPFDYHLRAVAAALSVPFEQVRQAAIAQWLPQEGARRRANDEKEQTREELLRLRNEITAALNRIDESDGRRATAKRPKSA
jgi:hypothetical protein